MKLKIKILVLLFISMISTVLNATTVYYNGENDDVGEWLIQNGSANSANISEVHDNTLNSTVMEFTDGGIYRLRLPNNQLWNNPTERVLSFDMNLDSTFTIDVFVATEQGWRKLFLNDLNIHVGHHNGGIRFAFGGNRLMRDDNRNNGYVHRGWGVHPEYRNNRNGWVRVTVDLDRVIRDLEPDNRITNVLFMRIAGTSGRIDNVTLDAPNRVTRANSEANWQVTPDTPDNGTINLVQDNAERGDVIEFDGEVNSNSFTTGARVGAGRWSDSEHDIIQWKIQTEDPFKFVVHVDTQNGVRDLVYHGGKRRADDDRWWTRPLTSPVIERGFNATHNEIYIGLGVRKHLGDDSPDNNGDGIGDYDSGTGPTWKTFTRNLAKDVAEFENGNTLISVNGITVVGTNTFEHNSPMIDSTIRIDDIQLFTAVVPSDEDTGNNSGAADDLHRWRLRETSVRISFRDNANDETGFRFINADTGEQMGNTLPAREGTGLASIGQINGLLAGTTYRVQVQTTFASNRVAISEPIEFTTLGELVDNAEAADDLHRWRLRETSVRISFRDNANDETGFRFINADTGEQMGNNLPATEGTGTASIGQINGLTSDTTYSVQVQTLFNGRTPATSEPITFTTN